VVVVAVSKNVPSTFTARIPFLLALPVLASNTMLLVTRMVVLTALALKSKAPTTQRLMATMLSTRMLVMALWAVSLLELPGIRMHSEHIKANRNMIRVIMRLMIPRITLTINRNIGDMISNRIILRLMR
jgi:hypothetical protein